ncbi:MAG TPA: hypothetical protein VG144_14665 [Gaiellaceae bacterium]|nr:hypothetical protein [Gaiellaceae bacterium]
MAKPFDPKAKARKQKILLGVLGVVLAGVLAFQAPTILGLFGGGSSEVASEPAPPAPVPVAPATPATPAAAASSQLVDSDVMPQPAEGQLVTFDRFESKDPFAQQAEEEPATAAAPPPSRPAKDRLPEDNFEPVPQPAAPPAARSITTATITVNGVSSDVGVGDAFPEGEPVFRLVSLKKGSVKIGIVDGTYASGSATITLKKGGKPVTLMNTAEGTTYVLRLVSVA